jgi:putative toxin-antitoxin system antitoxin component (TIGR02293 family)
MKESVGLGHILITRNHMGQRKMIEAGPSAKAPSKMVRLPSVPVGILKEGKPVKKADVSRLFKTSPIVNDAVARTAELRRIESIARQVWGNEEDAARWLNRPHPLLDGATPRSRLATVAGKNQVVDILSALDNGFPV